MDPARGDEMGRRARQTILETYDLPLMVRVYAEAAAEALGVRRQVA